MNFDRGLQRLAASSKWLGYAIIAVALVGSVITGAGKDISDGLAVAGAGSLVGGVFVWAGWLLRGFTSADK